MNYYKLKLYLTGRKKLIKSKLKYSKKENIYEQCMRLEARLDEIEQLELTLKEWRVKQ